MPEAFSKRLLSSAVETQNVRRNAKPEPIPPPTETGLKTDSEYCENKAIFIENSATFREIYTTFVGDYYLFVFFFDRLYYNLYTGRMNYMAATKRFTKK